jgi:hypothetical protein
MHEALSGSHRDEDSGPDPEDIVSEALEKRMAARKMLTNASYFAFTATPKNRTLEMFGEALPRDADGKVKRRPFHSYTMKQAIDEGFILDVLKSYTPVESYYKLVTKTEEDPEFDKKKAQKKLRRYVESHDHAIRLKAEIMVDHFHEQVLATGKIGGQARAMVVCSGIERAIQYFHAVKATSQPSCCNFALPGLVGQNLPPRALCLVVMPLSVWELLTEHALGARRARRQLAVQPARRFRGLSRRLAHVSCRPGTSVIDR